MAEGERATGTPNTIYDLSSVLFHALEGGASYNQYMQDAEEAGDEELVDFFTRVRDEDSMRADEAQRLLTERTPTAGRSGGPARPMERAASEPPPREQAEADLEDIKEDIRREDGPRRRTEVGSPRTEEASPQGRGERAGRPETGREEDRGLLDKAKDALTGQEEEPRRREGPGTRREEPQRRESPRGAQGDEPLR